jgi:hypothetical protein
MFPDALSRDLWSFPTLTAPWLIVLLEVTLGAQQQGEEGNEKCGPHSWRWSYGIAPQNMHHLRNGGEWLGRTWAFLRQNSPIGYRQVNALRALNISSQDMCDSTVVLP